MRKFLTAWFLLPAAFLAVVSFFGWWFALGGFLTGPGLASWVELANAGFRLAAFTGAVLVLYRVGGFGRPRTPRVVYVTAPVR